MVGGHNSRAAQVRWILTETQRAAAFEVAVEYWGPSMEISHGS